MEVCVPEQVAWLAFVGRHVIHIFDYLRQAVCELRCRSRLRVMKLKDVGLGHWGTELGSEEVYLQTIHSRLRFIPVLNPRIN